MEGAQPMNRAARRVVGAACACLVVILALGGWRALQIVSIGVAYKAKMLCSETFVARREPATALADLQIDDLAILRHVHAAADTNDRFVTASALGLVTRRAVYREGLGCALVLDGHTPPVLDADLSVVRAGVATPPDLALNAPGPSHAATTPELQAVIDRAFAEPAFGWLRRTQAVVVVHRGRIVGERYAGGIGPDTPLIGWSMTKSVMNALAGILVRQGRLTLDGALPIPEWQGTDDPRRRITLNHLLRMSSGLQFDENMSAPRGDVMRMLLDAGDASAYAINKHLNATPGTAWHYSSGSTNVIARAMRNTLQDDQEYWSFPSRALFRRIGMSSAVLETDASGTFVASSYMYATPRDWARFGLLYVRDGTWNGERILPEGWVTHSTSPVPSDPTRSYGAHFWLAVPSEYRGADLRLPADTFHAVGHEAQFVTIVPSRETVVVRMGRTRYPEAWDHTTFTYQVLQALEPLGPPAR
jgi:CubicO group peptidase (beta-lactamase class C family)